MDRTIVKRLYSIEEDIQVLEVDNAILLDPASDKCHISSQANMSSFSGQYDSRMPFASGSHSS